MSPVYPEYSSTSHALIEHRDLADVIRLHPTDPVVVGKIASSLIYAMTSRSECFHMVLLEAMQQGVPVVAYDCPTGPRSIVRHGIAGRLVTDGDTQDFADTLVELSRDKALLDRLQVQAREESKRYELPQVMPMWDRLFELAR